MSEDTWITIVEWLDEQPRWIKYGGGWILQWTSKDWWGYLFGPNNVGSRDNFSFSGIMHKQIMLVYPVKWEGKFVVSGWEVYLVPERIARFITKMQIAWCRRKGHRKKGKDQVSMSYGYSCGEPLYTCNNCGDEVG